MEKYYEIARDKNAPRELKLNAWTQIIADKTRSGISASEYCKQHGISSCQYYYWNSDINGQAASGLPAPDPAPLQTKGEDQRFVELSVPAVAMQIQPPSVPAPDSNITITKGDIWLSFPDDTDRHKIARFMEVFLDA